MKLLLADDHALFRDALFEYIERSEHQAKVTLAKDMHEVMEIMESGADKSFDLVLLDMNMPGMHGLQGLEKFRESFPKVPVAIMSGVAEKEHVDEAMKMGAMGYFPKTMSGKSLMKAVEQVVSGEKYIAIDHNTNEYMPSHHGSNGGYQFPGLKDNAQIALENDVKLTPRETEVLAFLLRGASNKEIARELDLQVVTVKLHVRGICRKLDAKNRTQAALKAREMGLVAH